MGNRLKISRYFTTSQLTRGFWAAFLASAFLYLAWIGYSHLLPNTILAILALYLLLSSDPKSWLISGFLIGIFWFWWMMMSFRLYGFPWAIPIGILLTALVYALLFWSAAALSHLIERKFHLSSVWIKAVFLLTVSMIHPFGFDWFKPELMLTESYLGIEKWRFAITLLAIALAITQKNLYYLLMIAFAYQPTFAAQVVPNFLQTTKIVSTAIPIDTKWDPKLLAPQINLVIGEIDKAIKNEKKHILFPESVLPHFLNRDQELLEVLRDKSQRIVIILGALKWDENVPRNSTYIFQEGKMIIADKVVLVPFGESNPLPDWLSDWVNNLFFDGAVDYKASANISDYALDGKIYRNAICYEACSELLYDGQPEQMIVLSNNGWFTPSIEPTQQRLLLQYYSRKYGTTIYHSINMSPSYVIQGGSVIWEEKPPKKEEE